jgi:hypothetical protein
MNLPALPRALRAPDAADAYDLMRTLCEEGVADGLPVVSPTSARVDEMLRGHAGGRTLGALPPLYRDLTVEDVAVCAVLAGCGPEHLPALLAAVDAVQQPEVNLLGVATTTGTTAIGMILHGPYATRVGANGGTNCMGPGNVTNATLGRALALVLRAGGMIPGTLDMSTMGQPAKYGLCFAEAEHPTFPSYLGSIGLPAGSSAVSVFAASGTLEVVDSHSDTAEGLLDTLAAALPVPGTVHAEGSYLGSGRPLVVIPPEWADRLAKDGVSRAEACARLSEASVSAIDRLPASITASFDEAVRANGAVRTARDAESIALVVAGGIGSKATYIPTWHGGTAIATAGILYDQGSES